MKTSSFFLYAGPGRISIARYQPPKFAPVAAYPQLAPGEWFNRVSRPEYERLFAEQLHALDARTVWSDLHKLAGAVSKLDTARRVQIAHHENVVEPVLLCWETKNWRTCHRRLVSDWLKTELGEDVPEWQA